MQASSPHPIAAATLIAVALSPLIATGQDPLPEDDHWFYEYDALESSEPYAFERSGHHIYAGGLFLRTAGDPDKKNLARFNLLTETWEGVPGIDSGFNGGVWTIHNADNGLIYIGGNFSTILGADFSHIASFDPTTNTWIQLFDPSPDLLTVGQEAGPTNGRVFAIVKSGNFIYVGGEFTGPIGSPQNEKYIRRFRLDTNRWERVGGGLDEQVRALAIDTNGDIIAGGQFTGGLARWNGTSWSVVAGGLGGGFEGNPIVRSLAVSPEGTIFLGGDFDEVNAANSPIATRDVASVSPAGVWNTLAGGFDDEYRQSNGTNFNSDGVYALVIDGSGDLIAGGDFDASNGRAVTGLRHIARWDGTGAWKPLGSGLGTTGSQIVNCLATGTMGDLFAGGIFSEGWRVPPRSAKTSFARWMPSRDFSGYIPGAADNSTVRISTVDADTRAVTLQTRPGTTYIIDASSNGVDWTEIGGTTIDGNGLVKGFQLSSDSTNRVYRIRATDY